MAGQASDAITGSGRGLIGGLWWSTWETKNKKKIRVNSVCSFFPDFRFYFCSFFPVLQVESPFGISTQSPHSNPSSTSSAAISTLGALNDLHPVKCKLCVLSNSDNRRTAESWWSLFLCPTIHSFLGSSQLWAPLYTMCMLGFLSTFT